MIYNMIRRVAALLLFICSLYFAFRHEYARACFDLLLAAVTYPEAWLRTNVEQLDKMPRPKRAFMSRVRGD